MTTRNIGLIVVILLAPVGIWFWMNYCSAKQVDQDYSIEDPGTIYQQVIGTSLPKGLDEVKIAGHHGILKGQLWMKLHGSATAMHSVTAKAEHVYQNKFSYTIPTGSFGVDRVFHQDAVAAGWDAVPGLQHADAYIFQTNNGDSNWQGTIVVDGGSKTAYVYAMQQ